MCPTHQTLSRRYTTMLVAALSLIALTCVALLVPVPYVMMRPGPAFDTLGEFEGKPMFTFDKSVKTYPTDGSLDFTTVSVTRADRNVSLGEAIRAYFGSDNAVVPKSLIYPDDETAEQSTKEGAAQLDSSKDSSRVAALRAAGYTVTGTPRDRRRRQGRRRRRQAQGRRPGDRRSTGPRSTRPRRWSRPSATHKPGDVVTVSITRKGKAQDVAITTKPALGQSRRSRASASRSAPSTPTRSRSTTTSAARSADRAPARCSRWRSTTS